MRGDAKLRAKAKSGSSARSGIRTGGTDIDEAFDATWAEMPKMLRRPASDSGRKKHAQKRAAAQRLALDGVAQVSAPGAGQAIGLRPMAGAWR